MKKRIQHDPDAAPSATAASSKSSARGDVYRAACAYRRAGFSIIPIKPDGTKAPALNSWKMYQQRRPTIEELREWFHPDHAAAKCGVAVIAGMVSGGLEVIDIDSEKYIEPWRRLVKRTAPGLLKKLVMIRTPRPGMHVYYRCEEAGGNQKLARVPVINKKIGKRRPRVSIEVKGEGGYTVAPGSPPECHPTGRCYEFLNGRDLTMIQSITADERAVLLDAARALNRWRDPREHQHLKPHAQPLGAPRGGRPGDDFNERGDWHEILEPNGWHLLFTGKDGTEYWRRPGKNAGGSSATVNHGGFNLLYVFSSNAHPFDAERPYTKFHAFALLEHGGDFHEAARELAAQGYGQPRRRRLRRGKKLRNPGLFAQYAEFTAPPGWRR